MPKSLIISAIAIALTVTCSVNVSAYSGDFSGDLSNSSAPPVLFELDGGHAQSEGSPSAEPVLDEPQPAREGQVAHAEQERARDPASHDDFQRYFDQHYRAHPVLNASAYLFFKVD